MAYFNHKNKQSSNTRREFFKKLGKYSVLGLTGSSLLHLFCQDDQDGLAYQSTPTTFKIPTGYTLEKKPNIIFILSDNTRYDCFGFMDHPFIQTPAIDKLAAEGLVFTQAFNTTSLCSPSRASILTGKYAHNHGVINNHTPWTGDQLTFLEMMQQAGYSTAFIGKWHMPGEGLPNLPIDLFLSYTYREGQGSYFHCPLIVNGEEVPSRKAYITEEVTDWAMDFMEEHKENPFCIYLSHRTAHPPFKSPSEIEGMYDSVKVEMPDVVDVWFSKTNGNVFQGIMMGSYKDQYRGYCETITAMDRDIATLLAKVDELGLRENTLVVYAGDNGMMWGEHRCHGIREPYEESIRIPFIVRCPWLVDDPGGKREQMVLNIDFAATFLDAAGLPIPEEMDGESVLPYLSQKEEKGREAFLLEFWKYFPENTPSYAGVRTQTHKYIEYEKSREPQLFDLIEDPGEYNNIYFDEVGQSILPDLKFQLEKFVSNYRL